jgi:hypothetical protein
MADFAAKVPNWRSISRICHQPPELAVNLQNRPLNRRGVAKLGAAFCRQPTDHLNGVDAKRNTSLKRDEKILLSDDMGRSISKSRGMAPFSGAPARPFCAGNFLHRDI